MNEQRMLLGFHYEHGYYVARTQRLIRIKGLFILGALPSEVMISGVLVGNREEVLCSIDPVPANIFHLQKSFEELERALEEGKELLSTWMSLPEVYPGLDIRIQVFPIFTELKMVMWGVTVL